MLAFPQIDPVAVRIGPLAVHWYGLMYLLGFASVWFLVNWRIKMGKTRLNQKDLEDLIFYAVLGVVLGGRLGYVLFYKPAYYFSHPQEIFFLWQGGMSFHGGLLGVIAVILLLAWLRKYRWMEVSDFVAPLCPLALAAGRLGNFINGELWGRITDVPWAMVFPGSGDGLPRHPSQLYNLSLECICLFVLLWWFSNKPRPLGQTSAVFLIGYGCLRFIEEFAREPDDFLGFLVAGSTMGQLLSLPMVATGIIMFIVCGRHASKAS